MCPVNGQFNSDNRLRNYFQKNTEKFGSVKNYTYICREINDNNRCNRNES